MGRPRLFPSSTGWRRVLLVTAAAGVSTALAGILLAAMVSGWSAAASAAVAGGAVIGFSGLSLGLIDWADRHAPHLSIPLFMLGFGLKVAALAAALPFLAPGDWLRPGWAIGVGLAVLLTWQFAEIHSFTRMRISVEPGN